MKTRMLNRALTRVVPALGAAAAALVIVSTLAARQEQGFPHEDHEGLFPVCAGCHDDMTADDRADFYPEPAQCAGCHDGVTEPRVGWSGPVARVTNVSFDHEAHTAALTGAGDPAVTCEGCHSETSGGRMSVDDSEELGTCWSCHAHERDDHYALEGAAGGGGTCENCHVPLAESAFDRSRLEALPAPADHEADGFLLDEHGEAVLSDAARCATCHTADRCVACHVDAGLEEIVAIPAAPAGMDQPVWGHRYPVPATHAISDFDMVHRPASTDAAECSTCHTSDDCMSCHVAPAPGPVEALVSRASAIAPGASLEVTAPDSHESIFFMDAHPGLAASDPSTCATCHTETYCVQCHDGPSDGGYHPPSFVARHAADAYGRDSECATCHSTAAFCRECHEDSGLGGEGRLGAGYHDAEPVWLLRHGGPARQNLESCASCHQQTDCVQCHGVLGSFGVSPHTDDFDAEAAWARSPRTCIACHTSNPVGGSP